MKPFILKAMLCTMLASSTMAFANNAIIVDNLAIESYINEFEVSGTEAEKRLKIMAQNDKIISKLNDEFGDTIASIFYDNGNDFKMVIRTAKKGDHKKQVENLVNQISKEYGLKIEVIANHPRNFKSVQNIISNQGDRISKQYPSYQSIGYNPKEDAIYLAFYEPNNQNQEQIKKQFKKLSGMDTIIEFLDNPIKHTSIIGGGGLEYSDTSQGACTVGFAGTMNGQVGFITATHCADDDFPINYTSISGQKYKLGKPITDKSVYHEVSFIPTPNTKITNEVYRYLDGKGVNQTYKTNMKITGLGVLQARDIYNGYHTGGLQLCHIGQRTGYSCGLVTQVNVGGGGCNATLPGNDHKKCQPTFFMVEGKQHNINKGDSGGPYFDGSGKAYGLASAMGNLNSAIVTPITYIVQSGFQLKTSK